MMDWLGQWLKQVILIVLLASFVDLLLPNQSMQRYVKTVVSLFILMTLLSPVFSLLERGWNADKLLAEAGLLQSGGSPSSGSGIRTLQDIMADSRKLASDNSRNAKKLAESSLAEEMKAGLEQATGVKVGELTTQINLDNQGNPVIGSVRATFLHKQQTDARSTAGAVNSPIAEVRVEEVKPVSIDIGPVGGAAGKSVPAAAGVQGPEDGERTALKEHAESYFRQEWKLGPEQLQLRIES